MDQGDVVHISKTYVDGASGPYQTWWRANGAAQTELRYRVATARRSLSALLRLRPPADPA